VDLVNGVDRRFGVVGRPHLAPAFHNPYSFGLWDSLIALLVLVGLALFPDSTCVCRCLRLSLSFLAVSSTRYHGPCSVDFRFSVSTFYARERERETQRERERERVCVRGSWINYC
jgi:hypothetical protein